MYRAWKLKEKIRKWADQNRDEIGIGESDFSLEELTEGESNHVFKLETRDKLLLETPDELIIRTSLDVSEDRISHEAKILDILEEKGIENVPRKIYCEHSSLLDQPVLVETFVGNKETSFEGLTFKQKEDFARRLAEIHSINSEAYNQIFNENEPEEASMRRELEGNFQKYSKKRFEEYCKAAENVDSRVRDLYERHSKLYRKMIEYEGDLPWKMSHGDPSANIRVSGDEVFIFDWEFAKPGVPRFELVYMFRHNNLDQDERENFLQIYQKYRKTSEFADRHAREWEKFRAFNDMIWAAERKEKIRRKGEDPSKYEKMFEKRLREVQEMYKT